MTVSPAARLERVLSVGRAFLTTTGLIAIYIDPTEPSRFAGFTYAILLAYAVYSLLVLAAMHSRMRVSRGHGRALHAIDMLFTALLTFLSDGPGSPFFLFFLFVVAAAAYRWGVREVILTAIVTLGIFSIETLLAVAGPWGATFGQVSFQLNRTILRVSYLLLTGFLLGYLAEQEKQSKSELAALVDLPGQPRVDRGLRGAISEIAENLLRAFNAKAIAIVVEERISGIASLWRMERSLDGTPARAVRQEIDAAARRHWLFDDPGRTWHFRLGADPALSTYHVVESGMWGLRRVIGPPPPPLAVSYMSQTLTAVNVGMPDEWRGRVYLIDVSNTNSLERMVHFLDAAGKRLGPTLTNVFLLRRLRMQDSAAERARVARELHDGTIQALFGIEMKLEALRRTPAAESEKDAAVAEIQAMVRREILALRELMNALRPVELDANEKLDEVIAGIVERFRRDTGLSARFLMSGDPPKLTPAAALELIRILQEALVNVRKHSRARNVFVRLAPQDGGHKLTIEDDGKGFEFNGRFDAIELAKRRIGPAIIKERARLLGAALVVGSAPGGGATIELTLSNQIHA